MAFQAMNHGLEARATSSPIIRAIHNLRAEEVLGRQWRVRSFAYIGVHPRLIANHVRKRLTDLLNLGRADRPDVGIVGVFEHEVLVVILGFMEGA